MLQELMQIQFPDEVSMLLCISFNRNNLNAIQNLDRDEIDKVSPALHTTMFFKITTTEGGRRNLFEMIAEKENFRIDEEDDLSEFLNDRILRHYKAKRYLMFTWDHGNGFEIFSSGDTPEKTNKEVNALTMDELAQAIGWAMNDKKIHLTIMMNCRMQVFDTGYALRDHVKYLVAAETQLGFMEYDYLGIFSYLAQKPTVSPRALAAYVISSFKKKSLVRNTGRGVALSVCRLKHFNLIATILNQLATRLLRRLPQDFACIRDAFRAAERIQGGNLVDLYSLLTELSAGGTGEEQVLINQLFLLKYQGIYRRFIGADLFADNALAAERYNGISILSPIRRRLPPELFADVQKFLIPSPFRKNDEWDKLCRELERLDLLPDGVIPPCVVPLGTPVPRI